MPRKTQHFQPLKTVTLQSGGATLVLLNYGATTCDWRVPVGGKQIPMVLGFEDLNQYLSSPFYFGAIVGRVSNRIGSGRFPLGDTEVQLPQNEETSTLHGGPNGLSSVLWSLDQPSQNSAVLTYTSPDGENGFPGEVLFQVEVQLTARALTYRMSAAVSQITPISMAQHNYYNFGGTGDIWDYKISAASHQVLEQDKAGVSTGTVRDITGTELDLRKKGPLGRFAQRGLDDHFLFDDGGAQLRAVAEFHRPDGLGVQVNSDQSGAQIYTAHALPELPGGLDGQTYGPASGICFEPQGHPNAVNIPQFPSVMVQPETPYQQVLTLDVVGLGD